MDGIALKVEDNKLDHVCTFPALGYVQVLDKIYIDQPSCGQNIRLISTKRTKDAIYWSLILSTIQDLET